MHDEHNLLGPVRTMNIYYNLSMKWCTLLMAANVKTTETEQSR